MPSNPAAAFYLSEELPYENEAQQFAFAMSAVHAELCMTIGDAIGLACPPATVSTFAATLFDFAIAHPELIAYWQKQINKYGGTPYANPDWQDSLDNIAHMLRTDCAAQIED